MTDLSAERDALLDLFGRGDAWSALSEDGWLEALPEGDGSWPTVEVAQLAVELGATAEHPVSLGGQFAAAATLAEAGDGEPGLAAVLVDAQRGTGRLWGPPGATRAVVDTADGLGIVDVAALAIDSDPVLVLDGSDVRRARIAGATTPLAGDVAGHRARVAFFLAAEAIAVAEAATARTLEYLRSREQFGKPIGAQQVLQHRIVDMHMRALMARAALTTAASEMTGPASWRAKMLAGTAGVWIVENAIQLHGGIGFTQELGLGRSLRVAQRARLLLGGNEGAADAVIATSDFTPTPGLEDWSREFRPTGH